VSRQRPIDGRQGGLAEAVLRTNDRARDTRQTLERAAVKLFSVYPDSQLFVNVTANVVLQKGETFSLYFGQKFSAVSKEVLFGTEFDAEGGRDVAPATYELSAPTDVDRLPLRFSSEYFQELFKKNWGSSDVKVVQVVNVVYKFTKALRRYSHDKATEGQSWVSLF
jgi:hypothetical protein